MTEFTLILPRLTAQSTECIELTDSDSDYVDYYPLLYQGTSGEEDCELSSLDEEVGRCPPRFTIHTHTFQEYAIIKRETNVRIHSQPTIPRSSHLPAI